MNKKALWTMEDGTEITLLFDEEGNWTGDAEEGRLYGILLTEEELEERLEEIKRNEVVPNWDNFDIRW